MKLKTCLPCALFCLALALLLGGCSPPSILSGSESTATIYLGARIVGSPDGTRIEALHIAPLNGEGRLWFDPDYTRISVASPDGTRSVIDTEESLLGLTGQQAIDIIGAGLARVDIAVSSGGPPMRIEDGFGNSLALTGLSFEFWVPAQGETNLSDDWTLLVPMAGNSWDVARAQFDGVPAATQVTMQFGTASGNISDSFTTGPAAGDILLSDFGDSPASAVSQVHVSFERDTTVAVAGQP